MGSTPLSGAAGTTECLRFYFLNLKGKVTCALSATYSGLAKQNLTFSGEQLAQSTALIKQWPSLAISSHNYLGAATPIVQAYSLLALGKAALPQVLAWVRQAISLSGQHRLVVLLEPAAEPYRKHITQQFSGLTLVAKAQHAAAWIQQSQQVIVANSQLGFEALLWQKKVHCLTQQGYSGVGLTSDHYPAPDKKTPTSEHPLTLTELVATVLFVNSTTINYPETHFDNSVIGVVNWLSIQRSQQHKFAPVLQAYKFSRLWRPVLKQFLPHSKLKFVNTLNQLNHNMPTLCWGRRSLDYALPKNMPVIAIEDGFLRSVGLGAEFSAPVSWVFDKTGMYFDATEPSDLELILQHHNIGPEIQQRAAMLKQTILQQQLTKYNVGNASWQRPSHPKVILVPGQVESDASIRFGSPVVKRNIDLLRAVRQAEPHAYIVYKPHPDVVAGARAAGEQENTATLYCDEQVTHANIATMLPQVDEIHTITSLTGFEALLRGKKVVCYGQPFYAGWGLTTDIHPPKNRTRNRNLNELIAAALLLYPVYVSKQTGYYTSAEFIVHELSQWRQHPTPIAWLRVKKAVRRIIEWLKQRGVV